MDLQEQLEVGKQAEDFLKYTQEHPYFEGLLERIRLEHARLILDLAPDHHELFAKYRHRMNMIADIMEFVRGDVFLGAEAFKQINGLVDEDKGLL